MLKALLIISFMCSSIYTATAQALAPSMPGENSVVKDAEGTVYPYVIWRKLLTTGDYSMRFFRKAGTDSVTYTLVKRTEQEKEAMYARWPKPAESQYFKIGDALRPIKERDIKGVKLDQKSLAGKIIVLNFWFIGCPPCRAEIPDLNKLVETYNGNTDVVFIAVALDEAYEIKEFLKEHSFNYHIVENGRYYATKYGLNQYPTNIVYDAAGKVVFSSVSNQPSNPYWMKKAINEALANKIKQAAL
jgi:thiol-disulfide isomerase/thioredoxin